MNVLAIDQGTSATKALVVAADGAVLGEGQAPVQPRFGPAGAVEQDPAELLESVIAAGRQALAAARATGAEVTAVGLGNQIEHGDLGRVPLVGLEGDGAEERGLW